MADKDLIEARLRRTAKVRTDECGDDVIIYFRPTDKGLVRIALHADAPGYVGFRQHAEDPSFLLSCSCSVPDREELQSRLASFRTWLPTVRRHSGEEQGVIRWLHGGGEYHPSSDPRHATCDLEYRGLEKVLASTLAAPAPVRAAR